MKQILSIQSAVTVGAVGNSVAAPVITSLGLQPLLVDTVSLAAHPGYGTSAGGILDTASFAAILAAFAPLKILPDIDSVITGYLGDAAQIPPLETMLKNWQADQPGGFYILDPVLGDGGRLYVDRAIVDAMRQKLLPLAHIVTPNQFELGLLTGGEITQLDDAESAAKRLLESHPLLRAVVATGISNAAHGISDLCVERTHSQALHYPKRPHGVAGGGDLLTAILSCWLGAGHDLTTAFQTASHDAHHIIDRSQNAIEIALFDNLHRLTVCPALNR